MQIAGTHYTSMRLQPWDVIEAWDLGFFDGNIIKYIGRYKHKNGLEDLKKAQHYLERLIEQWEEQTKNTTDVITSTLKENLKEN